MKTCGMDWQAEFIEVIIDVLPDNGIFPQDNGIIFATNEPFREGT